MMFRKSRGRAPTPQQTGPSAWKLSNGETLVHVGLQKTGTTTLQRVLAGSREKLEQDGLRYPVADGSNHARAIEDLSGRCGHPIGARSTSGWPELLDQLRNPGARNVISAEILSQVSDSVVHEIVKSIGSVKVLVTCRPLPEMLSSRWQQKQRSLNPGGQFNRWLAKALENPTNGQIKLIDPTFVIRQWKEYLSPSSIAVLSVDSRDPNRLIQDFESLASLAPGTLPVQRSNRSLTHQETTLVAALGSRLNGVLSEGEYRRFVRSSVDKLVDKRMPHPSELPVAIPPWALGKIETYQEEMLHSLKSSGVQLLGNWEPFERITTPPNPVPENTTLDPNKVVDIDLAAELAAIIAIRARDLESSGDLADDKQIDITQKPPIHVVT